MKSVSVNYKYSENTFKPMKKWVLLAFLFLVPFVSATLNIDGPPRTEYNYGDTVLYSGYASSAEDFSGYLQFKVVCDNSTEFPYQLIPLTLSKGQTKIFPGEIMAPQIALSPFMSGDCVLNALLLQSGSVVESTSSNTFKVTPDLAGSFEVEKDILQKGEALILDGTVSKLDGRSLMGVAELYLTNNDTRFLIDIVNVEDGKFSYTYDTTLFQAGTYSLDVQARDLYGNQKYFSNVLSFTIISDLNVAANVEVKSLNPGDTLRVSGKVTDISLKDIASGSADIFFNNKRTTVPVKDGIFTFEEVLADDVKSGKHTLEFTVTDEFGNLGRTTAKVEVLQVPKSVDIGLQNTELNPLGLLEMNPKILDQAKDLVADDLSLKVYNSQDSLVYEKTAKSGQNVVLQIPQYAVPGSWRVTGEYKELKEELPLKILEHQEITTSLEGMILTLKNVGNVDYDDNIEVLLNDGSKTYKVTVRESLAPNQTYVVNLNEEVPSGDYSMDIPTLGKASESVKVLNGKKIKRFDLFYLILVVGVVLILVYELLTLKHPGKVKAQSRVSKQKTPAAYLKMQNKIKDAKYIEDFRDRLLDKVKKTENDAKTFARNRKGEAHPSEDKKKPPKEEGNVFSQMFG